MIRKDTADQINKVTQQSWPTPDYAAGTMSTTTHSK